MRRIVLLSHLIALPILLPGCEDSQNNNRYVPDSYVFITFNINAAQYNRLQIVNEWAVFSPEEGNCQDGSCGYRGVIVYRTIDGLVAFERACPTAPDRDCGVINVHPAGAYFYCGRFNRQGEPVFPCTGSKFQVLDGVPIEGPASQPLIQYNIRREGAIITIENR